VRREFGSLSVRGAGGYGGDSFFLYWDIGAAVLAFAESDQRDGEGWLICVGFGASFDREESQNL
jgi:hypothetical protein